MSNNNKIDLFLWVTTIGLNLVSTLIAWLFNKSKKIPLKKMLPTLFIIFTFSIFIFILLKFGLKGFIISMLIYIFLLELGVGIYLYSDFKFVLSGLNFIGIKKTFPIMKESREVGYSEFDLAKMAENSFKFCTISGRSIYNSEFENLLKAKAKDKCNFYFLLFDPESRYFEEKMRNEGSDTQNSKIKIINITKMLSNLKEQYKLNIHVRWYKEYPIWRFIFVDQQKAFVGFYPSGGKGYMGPWVVFKNMANSFYYPFDKYFDFLWESAIEKC